VGALSGGTLGAATGFGRFVEQAGDALLGEHVFGYLLERSMLVPQYVVATQATVISQTSQGKKHDAGGFVFAGGTRLYFKDLSVRGIRKLKFKGQTNLRRI